MKYTKKKNKDNKFNIKKKKKKNTLSNINKKF